MPRDQAVKLLPAEPLRHITFAPVIHQGMESTCSKHNSATVHITDQFPALDHNVSSLGAFLHEHELEVQLLLPCDGFHEVFLHSALSSMMRNITRMQTFVILCT